MSPSVSDSVLAGRYRLLEPIGIGGMAEVHRGWDTVLCRHVAVKLFQPGFDPAAGRRFDNEVRTLAGLSHPGLVSVYDADTRAGTPFVVLQLVEGRTLRELIDQGPLTLDRTRRLGAGLADALAHVHAHDLVHRDVKPSNILLDTEDNAYLADFGLVHLTGATRLTRTDQMVGTAAYLAPEQVLGEEIDHPADVYALGLVLLECLTGRREYPGGDVEAAVARLHRPPEIPGDLPPDVAELLSRMTSTSPDDRPTAHDCAQVLSTAFLPPGGAPVRDAEVTEKLTPPREPRTSWKTLVVSAGALAGAFAITVAATTGQEPATSAPPASPTQQASPERQDPTGTSGTPAEPRFMGTPQAPGTTPAATTPPLTTTGAAPAEAPAGGTGTGDTGTGDTGAGDPTAPVTTDPATGTTTEPAVTTTAQPTSSQVVPTSESAEPSSRPRGSRVPPSETGTEDGN